VHIKKLIGVIVGIIVMLLAVPLTLTGCNHPPVTEDDFELTITVEQTMFSPGDLVSAEITLTNLSGRRLRISYTHLFHLEIVGVIGSGFKDGLPLFSTLSRHSSMRRHLEIRIPHTLEVGTFKLLVTADFGVTSNPVGYRGIELTSNKIILTIV